MSFRTKARFSLLHTSFIIIVVCAFVSAATRLTSFALQSTTHTVVPEADASTNFMTPFTRLPRLGSALSAADSAENVESADIVGCLRSQQAHPTEDGTGSTGLF